MARVDQRTQRGREGDIPNRVKQIIWARSAGRCQFPTCRKLLIGHLASGNRGAKKGFHAHIIGASADGPRGDETLSRVFAGDPENIMLLCGACHDEVDNRQTRHLYPVELLREWKRQHEEWVELALASGPLRRTHILHFSAPIGPNEPRISIEDTLQAVVYDRAPASLSPISIQVQGSRYTDREEAYWRLQADTLRHDFLLQVRNRLERAEIDHLSVFGIAPQPLLMELGRLLSDIPDCSVFQRHRYPEPSWRWPDEGAPLGFSAHPGQAGASTIALKLEVTAAIDDARIEAAIGTEASIWAIRSSMHGHDILKRRADLAAFGTLAHQLFDEIRDRHGRNARLCIFPACPVACAIEFGRVWQPKAHLPMTIFDADNAGVFHERMRIGTTS